MSDNASAQILVAGAWRPAAATDSFHASNPRTGSPLAAPYPVSGWADCDAMLSAARDAAAELRAAPPASIAAFLTACADNIESSAAAIVDMAETETGLPARPRLAEVELPRTTGQLRQAAAAVREGTWRMATIDRAANIRSYLAPLGPVWTIGPNNFPLAYNAVCGGDFAAAIAAGNPVVAKAHPLHPGCSLLLARAVHAALAASDLPASTVQMFFHLSPEDGLKMAADRRLAAIGFTGSRAAGVQLKAAADKAGVLFYGEMSSLNPVVVLPGALAERGERIAAEFVQSVLMGAGQMCTKPGLLLLPAGDAGEAFLRTAAAAMNSAAVGHLFSAAGAQRLEQAVKRLCSSGATPIAGARNAGNSGFGFANTLLRIPADLFLRNPAALMEEAFGNAALVVLVADEPQLLAVLKQMDGNLTGSIYSATSGGDDAAYDAVAPLLRAKVGRLLNDKMPTGVAVTPAMQHGGPYPATGHPFFTAVGMPAAIRRFTMLQCFDNVREHRLPPALQNASPNGIMWRCIDGRYTRDGC